MLIPTRTNAAVLFLDLQEEIVKNCKAWATRAGTDSTRVPYP